MLLRFSVKNYKSLWERTELSMLKASKSEELPHHFVETAYGKYLKGAAIFGANASGKSNVIDSLQYAISLIKRPREKSSAVPVFRLNKDASNTDTEFEFDILIGEKKYWYSFAVDKKEIKYEVLKRIEKNNSETDIFSRIDNRYSFGPKYLLPQELNIFPQLTSLVKKHNLFLSELITRQSSVSDLLNWFTSKVVFLTEIELEKQLTIIKNNLGEAELDFISALLCKADVGINKLMISDNSETAKDLMNSSKEIFKDPDMFDRIKDQLMADFGKRIELQHSYGNTSVKFQLHDESKGTQKYLKLLPLLLNLNDDRTYVIDEFESSLHPQLAQYYINLFYEKNINHKSQIIFTTHEHTLMDRAFLRNDEVWFVKKNLDHSSDLYSLSQFKERNDKNLEKAYLEGRFEAVPILSPISFEGK